MRRILALAALLATPAVAHADTLNGGQVQIDLRLPDDNGVFQPGTPDPATPDYQRRFNLARCICSTSNNDVDHGDEATIFAAHLSFSTNPNPASTENNVQIWTGTGCDTDNLQTRSTTCGDAPKDTTTANQILNGYDSPISVAELEDPVNGKTCPGQAGTQSIWVATINTDGTFDTSSEFSKEIAYDPEIPPAPTKFTVAAGGDKRITLKWEALDATDDIYHWQALCAKKNADGSVSPAFSTPKALPVYERPTDVCGVPPSNSGVKVDVIGGPASTVVFAVDAAPAFDAMPVDAMPLDAATTPDANTSEVPAELLNLDPSYICADTASSTATDFSIEDLDNNQPYYVVLVAVDKAGNPHGVTTGTTLTPQATTDFWEELHPDGSDGPQGGFCLIADTYGDGGGPGGAITSALRGFRDQDLAGSAAGRWAIGEYYDHVAPLGAVARRSVIARVAFALVLLPVVAIALAWHFLGLPITLGLLVLIAMRKRIRLRTLRPALTAAALLLVPRMAAAQEFAPYWDQGGDQGNTSSQVVAPDDIAWHVGVKLGPYTPAIDSAFSGSPGPYEKMFGDGGKVMPVLEVDRILLHMTSGQLAVGGSIGVFGRTAYSFIEGTEMRSTVDQTKFRLLPIAANAAFRLTYLDDEYGVPIIPYVRGGLSYYVWWILAPDGSFAEVDGEKARGASLGVQGSVGLAVRAEGIDRAAAASMKDSGLDHAGFYAEYQLGWVNGFGSSKKLDVGDATWFAGVDFEF